MTELELKATNPWINVAELYNGSSHLISDDQRYICECDKAIIEEYNDNAKEEHKYKLNVPAYPWYGNPLTAKVIVLSLNPGYVERESKIARIIQNLPEKYTKGYTSHLTKMLTFETKGFLPEDKGCKDMTYRDIANFHQSWYWWDRLNNAFINNGQILSFEDINNRFAVIEFIAYSSKKYHPLKKGQILPSQIYNKQLIEHIIKNNPETLFIVSRNISMWREFLGDDIWSSGRFIETKDYLGQRFTKNILGEENYNKVVKAFKN